MTRRKQKLAERWRRLAAVVTIGLLAAFALTPAWAVITLEANFDSGSVCLIGSAACDDTGVPSSVSGNTVTLTGRDNFNNGQWKWLYFRASRVSGQLVDFKIGNDFNTGGSNLADHKMVFSYDQETWQFFDNNQLNNGAGTFEFSNDTAFTQHDVYVAYGLPYPYQQTVDHTAGLVASPWVAPTSTANASLVIGQSPGGIDDIGRTIAPRDLYGFKITDPATTGDKKKIVLAGGVHANEATGNWTLEGLTDFLVSNELEAAQLRRYAEFYVYPMANPDGRYAGNNRTTVQVNDTDPNRAWNPPSYTEPGDTSTLTDIARVGQSMRLDTGQDVDYLIDFHSTVNHSIPYHYGFILPEWQADPFWQSVLVREPALFTSNASLIDFTLAKFGRDVLNAEFSATFETLFIADENTDRFLNLGRNFGLSWHEAFFVPADLTFDGLLSASDWTAFIAGSEFNMSSLTAIERYALGDLDGDGKNSILDFALFKQFYVEANGQAAFAALFQTVPESTAWILALLGSVMLATGARFKRSEMSQRLNCLPDTEG